MKKSLVPVESLSELMQRDPAVYEKCTEYLSQGNSVTGTSALTGVASGTVRAIREVLGDAVVHAGIRRAGANITEAVSILSERLIEEASALPVDKIPGALGVLIDRALLINGGPTVRVEHTKVLSREELLRMYDSLIKKADAREINRVGNGSS
jgi:hypothetical protein